MVILIVFLGLAAGLWPVISGMFPVTFDQGRDWLWVQNQFILGRPSLVGPAGSIAGVFFGPLWFWLLALPFYLSGGHPLVITLFNALIVYSAIIAAAIIFKKHARLILLLGFGSPGFHNLANHAFSQHLLPLLTLGFIYSLIKSKFAWAALAVGLMWHAEPPIAVFSLPVLIFLAAKYKINRRTAGWCLAALAVSFLPLVLFDFRHDWIQFRSLIDFIGGNTRGLQEIRPLTFWERILDRPQKFWAVWQQTLGLPLGLLALWLAWQNKVSKFIKASWLYIVSLGLIFVFYPHDLKGFYLDGVKLLVIIIAAFSLKRLPLWLIAGLVIINLALMRPSREFKSLYINQVEAIDTIYQDAAGEGFKVYNFVPAIYDYNWQYLWQWRGLNHWDYLPQEFAYWPDVPEYVPFKQAALAQLSDKIKPAGNKVYLVVTTGSVQERLDWFSRFANMNWVFINKQLLPDGTAIEKFEAQ